MNGAERQNTTQVVLCACFVFALCACGQPAKQPTPPPMPHEATPQETPLAASLRAQSGKTYEEFIETAGMYRYTPENLGLNDRAAARFDRDMTMQLRSTIVSENGVSALVFSGFAMHAGDSTFSTLAIDFQDGGVFIGVSDEGGRAVLMPNTRLQTLLTRSARWGDQVEQPRSSQ